MKHILAFLVAMLALGCATFQAPQPNGFMGGASSTAPTPHKLGQGIVPQEAGDFYVSPIATSPFTIRDGSAVQRVQFETLHGRGTFGGGGSDTAATLGPVPGFETSLVGLWLLQHGVSPTLSNPSLDTDSSNDLIFNLTNSGSPQFFWQIGNSTTWAQLSSTTLLLSMGTTPIIQSGTSATSLGVGTNKAGAVTNIFDDANAKAYAYTLSSSTTQRTDFYSGNGTSQMNQTVTDGGIITYTLGGNFWAVINSLGEFYLGGGGPIIYGNTVQIQNYAGSSTYAAFAAAGDTIGISGGTQAHTINGSVAVTTRTITGNLTVDTTTTDFEILVDTSGGAVSVTFPAPTNGRIGKIVDKKGTFGTNACTLVRHGTEKIDGVAASKVLSANGGRYTFTSDGTDWYSENVSGMRPSADAGALLALGLLAASRRRRPDNDVAKEAA